MCYAHGSLVLHFGMTVSYMFLMPLNNCIMNAGSNLYLLLQDWNNVSI